MIFFCGTNAGISTLASSKVFPVLTHSLCSLIPSHDALHIICPVFVYLANCSSHLPQPFWITAPHIACHSSHSFWLTLLYPKLVTECCQNCYSISQTAVFCCDNRLMYAPERTHSLHIKYLQCRDKHNQVFKYFKEKLTWRFKIGNNWKEIIPN